MSDTNGSVSIDSISLEITSNSAQAVDSINKLASSLGALNSKLSGKGINNMSKIALGLNSIARSGSKIDLSKTISQLSAMSNLNLKATGIASFANALTNLSDKSTHIDVSIFTKLANEMKNLGEVSSSSTDFLKSVSSLIRASDKMQTAAQNFPALTAQIQDFFASISQVNVSDNTVMLAQSLADISKHGVKANSEMKRFSQNSASAQKVIKILDITIGSIKDGFKTLGSILTKLTSGIKDFAVKATEGVKSLASKIKEMTAHKESVETLHFSLKSLFMTLIGFRGITGVFSWTKDALEAGGALTEIDHIVESVYGDMSDTVKAWADGMIDNYGIASTAAKQYAGTLTAMAKASGVAQESAAVMGMKLTEAAGDISAFFNIDTAEAFQKIQSGLAGQVRPLRSLGIDLTAATLKEYALAQGIEKSYSNMTQAEKVMLRYKYIMDVLSSTYEKGIGVTGDYARTSDRILCVA